MKTSLSRSAQFLLLSTTAFPACHELSGFPEPMNSGSINMLEKPEVLSTAEFRENKPEQFVNKWANIEQALNKFHNIMSVYLISEAQNPGCLSRLSEEPYRAVMSQTRSMAMAADDFYSWYESKQDPVPSLVQQLRDFSLSLGDFSQAIGNGQMASAVQNLPAYSSCFKDGVRLWSKLNKLQDLMGFTPPQAKSKINQSLALAASTEISPEICAAQINKFINQICETPRVRATPQRSADNLAYSSWDNTPQYYWTLSGQGSSFGYTDQYSAHSLFTDGMKVYESVKLAQGTFEAAALVSEVGLGGAVLETGFIETALEWFVIVFGV